MTWTVFAVVLFAAALHAGWNALVKRTGGPAPADSQSATVLVAVGAAAVAGCALPFLPRPAPASWSFIAASTALQAIYFALVARAYRTADMSLAYPVMRGGAPLIVALAGQVVFSEPLRSLAWLGIAAVCGGVLIMALDHRGPARGLGAALANAAVIAAYTLVDGLGVRRSGAPAAYTLWLFLLTGLVLAAWALAIQGRTFLVEARRRWPAGLAGGTGAAASYGLALWAMTQAPVAEVAALRETSILFGAAISVLLLKERASAARLAAAGVIAAGAVLLRLA